ncbi:MAG: phosphonopyruvate decarboxylase [Oscillospiraceae bacterium]
MINTSVFMQTLASVGYEKVLSVPCSFLKYPINYAVNTGNYIPVANEGEAVAISAGMALANKKSIVFMQNSGLSNAMSPLTSLNAIYKIPCLMVIGYRGSSKDEPQHKLMGKITEKLLDDMDIKYEILSLEQDEALAQAKRAAEYIEKSNKMYCLLVKKDTFEAVELKDSAQSKSNLMRCELLEILAQSRDNNTIIVTTTGFTSRELYQLEDNKQNFYMVGSMGCASSIGLGLALANPNKKVVVVDGDGAFLMRPSILPVLSAQRPQNFMHIVFSNETYESTGSQPLPKMQFTLSEMMKLVYRENTFCAANVNEFSKAIKDFLAKPSFTGLYAEIKSKCMDNLGRPTQTSEELKERFLAEYNR